MSSVLEYSGNLKQLLSVPSFPWHDLRLSEGTDLFFHTPGVAHEGLTIDEEVSTPLSGTLSLVQEAAPTPPQETDHRQTWVLTRGQGFCLLLFLRILPNPDIDLEVRCEIKRA